FVVSTHSGTTWRYPFMNSQELELFSRLLAPHNRREFMRRAGALGLSATALSAFLEACGSSGSGTGGTTSNVNMAGPIDMNTLMTNAKKEGTLEAIGFPPDWADYGDIFSGYTSHYGVNIAYKPEQNYTSAQELEVFKKSQQH